MEEYLPHLAPIDTPNGPGVVWGYDEDQVLVCHKKEDMLEDGDTIQGRICARWYPILSCKAGSMVQYKQGKKPRKGEKAHARERMDEPITEHSDHPVDRVSWYPDPDRTKLAEAKIAKVIPGSTRICPASSIVIRTSSGGAGTKRTNRG